MNSLKTPGEGSQSILRKEIRLQRKMKSFYCLLILLIFFWT